MADMGGWRQQQEIEEQRWHLERFYNLAKETKETKRKEKMAFAAKAATASGDFENVAPGTYGAVLTRIIDKGTQETMYGPKRKVMLQFELDELMGDGRPFLQGATFNLPEGDWHEKSKLRLTLESWRGKKFGPDDPIDLLAALGKPALLNLLESDKGFPYVNSVSPLPKSMTAPQPAGELIVFDLDKPDWDVFNDLSPYLQELIAGSPEYAKTPSPLGNAPKPAAPAAAPVARAAPPAPVKEAAQPLAADFDDDIPF